MDVLSHAAAGAATGSFYGRPLLGALIAVIPDLVLPLQRVANPPRRYKLTHNLLFVVCAGVAASYFGLGWLVFWCLLSHLFLDFFTHGDAWAPRLLYPWSDAYVSPLCGEWEWFNRTWWAGFCLTLNWSIIWLSLSGIGSPS